MNSKANDSLGPDPADTVNSTDIFLNDKTTLKNSTAAAAVLNRNILKNVTSYGFPSYYPGKARDLFESCENVMPLNFDGIKALSLNKLRPKYGDYEILYAHTFNVSSIKPGAYNFSALLKNNRCENVSKSVTLDLDPVNGNWNAEVGCTSRLVDSLANLQVHKWRKPIVSRVYVDYKKPNYTITGYLDPIKKFAGYQHMVAITDRTTLGGDIKVKYKLQKESDSFNNSYFKNIKSRILFKYSGPNYLWSARANILSPALKVCYYQHVSSIFQTGVTLNMNVPKRKGVTKVGLRALIKDDCLAKVAISSEGVVTCQLEKSVTDILSLSFSGLLNHKSNSFAIGVGLSME
ncbi:mitochondrial import receptor subunit TOM40 homolog 2-like [Daktulosphaira vitifoliae]|uniref:mitochondrial import receptor subunit TOM40 homolog 2-like n=1 Tax=Daktulosphaira vitifoliae TaxID=58002 RepID=UPI0021AAC3CD|nr:mitochondrial import receptor subunit TOM40 homolog 2-like [Daktulosphaira vitifoliae]